VFLVRKGNPKGIKDWGDLVKPGVSVITPNPKTSGGARWNHLAAWGYALRQPGGSEATARDFLSKLYKNVPVLDSGARGATTTFVERGIGDVLLAWENEALLASRNSARTSSRSSRRRSASWPSRRWRWSTRWSTSAAPARWPKPTCNTCTATKARTSRPRTTTARWSRKLAKQYAAQFPKVKLFTIDEIAGGWTKAQKAHFADGGVFDQIYQPPQQALPVPTIMVGSTNDPWMAAPRAELWARRWHSRFINGGPLGHINAESGLGDWPEGLETLYFLAEKAHNDALTAS
jgi:hypothetical protein